MKLSELNLNKKEIEKYIQRKQKNKLRIKTKKKKIKEINKFADGLNKCIPNSEKWFWNKYQLGKYDHKDDRPNIVINNTFIGDIVNNTFNYIIEIDGSIHFKNRQIIKDKNKDSFYKKNGYEVVRVIAFNEQSFRNAIIKIKMIRKEPIIILKRKYSQD